MGSSGLGEGWPVRWERYVQVVNDGLGRGEVRRLGRVFGVRELVMETIICCWEIEGGGDADSVDGRALVGDLESERRNGALDPVVEDGSGGIV